MTHSTFPTLFNRGNSGRKVRKTWKLPVLHHACATSPSSDSLLRKVMPRQKFTELFIAGRIEKTSNWSLKTLKFKVSTTISHMFLVPLLFEVKQIPVKQQFRQKLGTSSACCSPETGKKRRKRIWYIHIIQYINKYE